MSAVGPRPAKSLLNWKAWVMKVRILIAMLSLLLAAAPPALAHHPGADLDKMMGSEEKFFQTIDEPAAPPFELADADGKAVRLSDFSDKIVVLYFIFASCTDLCPVHSEVIADIQRKVNATPMKDRVQFLAVTTDPVRDTSEVLDAYGPAHGLDAGNWMFLTTRPGQPDGTTRKLSEALQCTLRAAGGRPADAWGRHPRHRSRRTLRCQVPRPQVRPAEYGSLYQRPHQQRPETGKT
jgi:cytochrome oxidase Cu insertion factor (SCO1/SenC/PrrC family)